MSCANDKTCLSLALIFQQISLKWVDLIGPQSEPRQSNYTKIGMLIDSSLIKLPVGGHETDDWTFDKVNLRIAFAV